jgi:hypothetical protein
MKRIAIVLGVLLGVAAVAAAGPLPTPARPIDKIRKGDRVDASLRKTATSAKLPRPWDPLGRRPTPHLSYGVRTPRR